MAMMTSPEILQKENETLRKENEILKRELVSGRPGTQGPLSKLLDKMRFTGKVRKENEALRKEIEALRTLNETLRKENATLKGESISTLLNKLRSAGPISQSFHSRGSSDSAMSSG